MKSHFSLIGIGVGPFNLSLAALLVKAPKVPAVFFEKKAKFEWHSELMLPDSVMQTSFMKDLVTPVDPTSPFSFMNYLVDQGLFYAFMHTGRKMISRLEFEQYCTWVSERMGDRLRFGEGVKQIDFSEGRFQVATEKGAFSSDHICVATGSVPNIPECAQAYLSPSIFHAKSPFLKDLSLRGKRLVVVGGGQTGIEIFRNAIQDRWGRAESIRLITARRSLEPLDESAFANEYFTPAYSKEFWNFSEEKKRDLVAYQKLTSDGNTPDYLFSLFNDLYQLKHVKRDARSIEILAGRSLERMKSQSEKSTLFLHNEFTGTAEECDADVVVLATGFRSPLPAALEPLRGRLHLGESERFRMGEHFTAAWEGSGKNNIYALNFSRHAHGIAEPQTSLMAWRSATVINHLAGEQIYQQNATRENFVRYGDL